MQDVSSSKYVQEVEILRQRFATLPAATQRLDGIHRNIMRLAQGKLPQRLPNLILPEAVLVEWALAQPQQDFTQSAAEFQRLDRCLQDYRGFLQDEFGFWGQITQAAAAAIARLPGKRYLEVMAGNGYLSYGLRQFKQQVYATDSLGWVAENETGKQQLTPIEQLDALAAYRKYRYQIDYVLMVWSPDGVPIDWQLLQLMRQDTPQIPLLCIGERNGCTNSAAFWQHAYFQQNEQVATLNSYFPTLDLVQEQLFWIR
ncbi:SAM-dependent methyltransferase [Loigolactobacillus coryniformis]|uniref:SAM-dependent methyltransferase n=1 Tax=Loigolactobacillus coryniformis TaxID=1610 RepID=A0A5B8THM9_9LACO|nr:SAM-dependent methyltransferase [Loigolactobacillus coryniformis]QEA53740.1 SAM-dependent methyltransferase [Loigolactobacillus coryniformis]